MTDSAAPVALNDVLRSAAAHLRGNPATEELAIALERLASALRNPNGYVVKAYGAGIRHDLCAPTRAEANRAAIGKGMSPDTYTVEPFLLLRP